MSTSSRTRPGRRPASTPAVAALLAAVLLPSLSGLLVAAAPPPRPDRAAVDTVAPEPAGEARAPAPVPIGGNGAAAPALLDAAAVVSPSAPVTGPVRPPAAPATADPAPPVLRLSGPVPSRGTGVFRYGTRYGPLLGRAGELRRYRVAVERESGADVEAFGVAVDAALADPRSWTASGRLRLQRVPAGVRYDFTVHLATAATARRMCAAGWVDIRLGGRPYTSCRAPGKVIINLDRWQLSVDHFVAAGIPLETYRRYVVNHEVGHELGHHHERCPGAGRPAPVMMQQTLFLKGCVANPWPYVAGRRYRGPAL